MELLYTLYDSSIYSHLLKDARYKLLDSPKIISKYGFPFISIYNLIELAGVDSFINFKKRITKLTNMNNLFTVKTEEQLLPCSNIDIITKEIEAWYLFGARSLKQTRDYIAKKIVPISMLYDDPTLEYLYQYAKEETKRHHFMSYTNGILDLPNPKLKMKDAQNLYFNQLDKTKLEHLYNSFSMNAIDRVKGINVIEAKNIADEFINGINGINSLSKKFESLLGYIGKYAEEEVDLDKTVKYYMNRCKFNSIKYINKEYFIKSGISMEDISIESSYFFKFQEYLNVEMNKELIHDTKRKIEGSNQCDIYLACYSLYVNVLADKRIYPMLITAQNSQYPEITFGKVNYNEYI